MKKLLLLGGSAYLVPVIETAHKLSVYVITCDYLPDNIAHKYADEYCNISILDKDAVLEMAKEKQIDGIMSFACDPGVVTAAYVAEKMGLPFQGSYESVSILQDKGYFREFLTKHNFNVPYAKRYTDKREAFEDVDLFKWPVIVKPVDSAGSKGVSRVDSSADLGTAIKRALEESRKEAFIIEEFIVFLGCHSSTDFFTVDGQIKFATFSDQIFDVEADNQYTPAWIIWPSSMENDRQKNLIEEIQRLMNLLEMRTGLYNIETCVSEEGKPYIMEVSPRGGGCRIAEVQKRAFGVDLIENEIRSAVGLPLKDIVQTECNGNWCEMVVHATGQVGGVLKEITISPEIANKNIEMMDLLVKKGDVVKPFTGANAALGDIILRFDSREELDNVMAESDKWLRIELMEDE